MAATVMRKVVTDFPATDEYRKDTNLESLKCIDIRTAQLSSLVDIRGIKPCLEPLKSERMLDFIRQIENPYAFRVGKMIVVLRFRDSDVTLTDKMKDLVMKYERL